MKIFYKKQLLLFGTALSFVQFIPAVVPGFWTLFICRSIAGLGIGFMYSFAASFAVDMFDEKEAGNMLGLRSTIGAVMGIIYQQLSGRFAAATGSYQRSFMLCLILIPIFLLILFKMPKSCPVEDYNREIAKMPKTEQPKEKRVRPLTLALLVVQFVTLLFAYSFMTNVAIICSAETAAGGMGMGCSHCRQRSVGIHHCYCCGRYSVFKSLDSSVQKPYHCGWYHLPGGGIGAGLPVRRHAEYASDVCGNSHLWLWL